MKRMIKSLAMLIAVCLALAGCGGEAPAAPQTPQTQEAPAQTAPQTQSQQAPAQAAPQTQSQQNAPAGKTPEPAPAEPEPRVEYLFNEPAVPLEGELGAINSFSAGYKGAVDGVKGEWNYELTWHKDLYGPGEDLIYLSGNILPEGKKHANVYLDMDADMAAEFARRISEAGFLSMNGYHVEEKGEAEDADRIVFRASYDSGAELYFEAAGDHMPEGFDESWQSFAMELNEAMGYATRGVTPFVPNGDYDLCQDMSNAVNWANAAYDDEYNLYVAAFSGGEAALAKNPMHLYDHEIIETGLWPHAVQFDRENDVLYFVGFDEETGQDDLYRYDGSSEPVKFIENVGDYCAAGGLFFYVDRNDGLLYSRDLSSGESSLFMDRHVHGFYPVDGWLVYVDEDGGNNIRAVEIESGVDVLLADDFCNNPVIDGNELYYVSGSKEIICSRDLASGEYTDYDELRTHTGFFMTGDYIYFYDDANDMAPTCVSRGYMSSVSDPEDPFDTARVFNGRGLEFIFASYSEVCYFMTDKEGYINSIWRSLNYYDGDSSYWLDPDDPDSAQPFDY